MRDRGADASSPGRGGRPSRSELREVVNHPHTLEVLDALEQRPRTVAALAASMTLRRRTLMASLRILAAHRLVVGDHPGSWDARTTSTTFRLTDRGRSTAQALSSFWVWASLYEQHPGRLGGSTDESGHRHSRPADPPPQSGHRGRPDSV